MTFDYPPTRQNEIFRTPGTLGQPAIAADVAPLLRSQSFVAGLAISKAAALRSKTLQPRRSTGSRIAGA